MSAPRGIAEAQRKLLALADSFGSAYTMTIVLLPEVSDRLGYFNDGTSKQPARPVFQLDGRARDEATRAIVERARADLRASGRINTLVAIQAGGEAVRRVYSDRLSRSGGDQRWAPLSPRYAFRKHRRGLDPRIGVATGAALRALASGRVVVSRVR